MDNIQPGQMLGAYRIISQIGQGGMATVYKAYHAAMDRYVAVKVLPYQLAENPEFSGRFQQEARTIARLEHARILPVYDYGESNGLAYLVMRFLDAGTLKDRMRTGPKSLSEVDRLFTQLAEALDYAHRQGVVHRDLKPSNVLIDAQGDLFLTDFGIAKLLEGGAQFTSTGAMMGTPAYMSPEQAQGEKVDQRSDIYSLGIILYELTTGRVPFEAETPLAVVLKQINAPLPPPSSLKPDFPPALERVLLKALAKSPADRFASVAEFLAAWKAALAQVDTVRAAAPTPAEVQAAVPATLISPAAATAVGPPPPPAGAPTAAPQRFPVLPVVGAVALLAVLGIVFAVFVLPNLSGGPSSEARATATLAATSAAEPTAPDRTEAAAATEAVPATEAPGAAVEPTWRSWTAANRVRALCVDDGELIAAGPGGITVWDIESETVLERHTTGNGLPHANVFAVVAGDNGGLWAGTEAGLARLEADSAEWRVYTTQNTSGGLDSDLVSALAIADDRLVVGTQYSDRDGGGLLIFDGRNWEPAPGFPSTHPDRALDEGKLANAVNVILPVEGGELWVGTEVGLGRYDRDAGEWTRYTTDDGLPDNRILSLYSDDDGVLFVGTGAGAASFDGTTFTPTDQAPPYGVYGIVQDDDGRYYFSGEGGIWQYDFAANLWEEFSPQAGTLDFYSITGAVAADGVLFFGSDGVGPIRYDGDEFTPWYQDDSTVAAWHGHFLRPPDESELWAVEAYGWYADRFNAASFAWEPYTENPCGCVPLTFDADGNLWGGRWQAGFVILAPDGALIEVGVDQGLPTEINASVIAPLGDGAAWLGTDENGLAYYDGQTVTFVGEAEGGPPPGRVWSLFLASDGALWAAVGEHVSRRDADGNWEHFRRGETFDDSFEWAWEFVEAADGALWVATHGGGVYRYQDGAWTQYTDGRRGVELPSDYLYAAAVAPDGGLWFGGDGGAARFDGADWTVYDTEDGLINNLVYDIYAEPSGAVWFATAGGVSRYGP